MHQSGRNSAVECQLPKLDVAGSIPVARSRIIISKLEVACRWQTTSLTRLSRLSGFGRVIMSKSQDAKKDAKKKPAKSAKEKKQAKQEKKNKEYLHGRRK
jgi:hypothetical protein